MGLFSSLRHHWDRLCPGICQICHRWPSQTLCETCIAQFAQPHRRCPQCATRLSASNVCPQCAMDATARDTATAQGDALYVAVPTQAVMGSLDACFCAVDYQYPWAQCIWQLKYTGRAAMARALADLMRHAPHIEVELERADWIVPIPISRTRLIERGFNQSMELVRFLCTDQLRHKIQRHALQRHEAHITQVGATRQERFAHLQDSFLITPPARQACIDKHVVLIDDVLTTGATLSAAAQLLRTSGAKKVSAVVFARTPPRQRQ